MRISEIKIGRRARKENGWLDSLERSIEYRGLLQPIGVTPEGELLFGARRLQACINLGWTEIPAHVIDVDASDSAAALKVERDENEVRKDFTPSEKVAIAEAIEEAMGNRQGKRSDLGKHLPKSEPAGKSTDIAASAVGWSGEQYRQAKKVMKEADDDTKAAVDEGKVSVAKAYKQVRGKQTKALSVRLAYDLTPDANVIISKAGGKYATELALKILEIEGHQVSYI